MTLSRRNLLTSVLAALTGKGKPVAFTNPVTGGQGTLVRPAIKSPGYTPGVTGWSINRDGSAEFNNLTLRGTFFGTTYIINASGAFFYSGAPGAGNMILSLASAAGTDAFGNAYVAGFGTYTGTVNTDHIDAATGNARFGNGAAAHLSIDAVNAVLSLANSAGATVIMKDAARQAEFQYSGVPAAGNLIQSVAVAAGTDSVGNSFPAGFTTYDRANNRYVNIVSGVVTVGLLVSGTPDLAHGGFLNAGTAVTTMGSTASATLPLPAYLNLFSGTTGQTTGSATAPAQQLVDPTGSSDVDSTLSGSLIKTNRSGVTYTWQTASYAANWSGSTTFDGFGGGNANLRFRQMVQDDTWIYGVAKAATGAGTTVFTLPAGYFNTHETTWGTCYRDSGGVFSVVTVAISTAGAVIIGVTPANGDQFLFNFKIPHGNIA